MPDDIDDEFVKTLLSKCERVTSWERFVDTITRRPKGRQICNWLGFGFCVFEKIESVWRCIRLFNGLKIDDTHTMEVKPTSYTLDRLSVLKAQIKFSVNYVNSFDRVKQLV